MVKRALSSWVLEAVGLGAMCWCLWGCACRAWATYRQHEERQQESMWLYTHCKANQQLSSHTDACDRAFALFAQTPWEVALHPHLKDIASWHLQAQDFVRQHHVAFFALWLFLFLWLPRLFIMPFKKEREKLFRRMQQRRSVV